jgi:alkanesulfonate monooxygenase SsuD/methylene tetrahydromethanopterin reductase-like flavin-dependent oxidoreductase (luciferase family)
MPDSSARLPAVSLVAMPGRRLRTLELAQEIELRGFGGIFGPSFGDVLSLCVSLAHVTSTIPFGSSILPIYGRRAADVAATASYVAEVSGGRMHLGLGVSHEPALKRQGLAEQVGRPLADTRAYVASVREAVGEKGVMPKIVLATLRKRMLALAVEIGDGAVWANGARSHMAESLSSVSIPADREFFVGNMIPTVIDEDRSAAAAVNRKTLTGYVALPNYRNYWKEAGYVEEMEAIEGALAKGDWAAVPGLMSDRWLSDVTLYGSAAEVREGVEAWFEAGVTTPIVVPSSTSGGQLKALEELFAAFS